MSDISAIATWAYAQDHDPIGYAEGLVNDLIEVHLTVAAARLDDPAAFPGYCIEPGIEPLARRILGELLDAGWTMPTGTSES